MYGKPCEDRGVGENRNAPECFAPQYIALNDIPNIAFEQIAMLSANMTKAQRMAFAHILLTANKCKSFGFLQKVWFPIANPKFLSNWCYGYVVSAPKIRQNNITNLDLSTGKVPTTTPIVIMMVTHGGMATATVLHDSVKSQTQFDAIRNECIRTGNILAPKKASRPAGDAVLDFRDKQRMVKESKEARQRNAVSEDDMDMVKAADDLLSGTDKTYAKIPGGSISKDVKPARGKSANQSKTPNNELKRNGHGRFFVSN